MLSTAVAQLLRVIRGISVIRVIRVIRGLRVVGGVSGRRAQSGQRALMSLISLMGVFGGLVSFVSGGDAGAIHLFADAAFFEKYRFRSLDNALEHVVELMAEGDGDVAKCFG